VEALGINQGLLIAQIVNFIIILFVLSRFVFPPVARMLEQRRLRIQESLAEAERVRRDAAAERSTFEQQLAEERRRIADELGRQAEQGQKVREEIIAAAEREREQILSNARREAEGLREQAVADSRRQVVELAILAAQRVVGGSMDEARQRQLVNDFLNRELELRRAGE
jgi:F-type H+-transporting ATPase subunit b